MVVQDTPDPKPGTRTPRSEAGFPGHDTSKYLDGLAKLVNGNPLAVKMLAYDFCQKKVDIKEYLPGLLEGATIDLEPNLAELDHESRVIGGTVTSAPRTSSMPPPRSVLPASLRATAILLMNTTRTCPTSRFGCTQLHSACSGESCPWKTLSPT